MRYLILLSTLILSTTLLSAQPYKGDSFEEAKKKGSANIVITYVETPAFVYLNKDNKLVGICVDIMDNFIRYVENIHKIKLNIRYEGKGDNFKEFYESVRTGSGGVFGLGNVTIREDRKKEVQFTPPYIKNIAVLVTQTSVPELNSLEGIGTQFRGLKAYVPQGTTHFERISELKNRYYKDMPISYTSNSFEAIQKVTEDPKSFCYQDIALFWDFKQKGHDIKRHPVGDKSTEELAMIMPMDSDWAEKFNEFFNLGQGFRSTPIYRRSLTMHLGNEVVQMLQMTTK